MLVIGEVVGDVRHAIAQQAVAAQVAHDVLGDEFLFLGEVKVHQLVHQVVGQRAALHHWRSPHLISGRSISLEKRIHGLIGRVIVALSIGQLHLWTLGGDFATIEFLAQIVALLAYLLQCRILLEFIFHLFNHGIGVALEDVGQLTLYALRQPLTLNLSLSLLCSLYISWH